MNEHTKGDGWTHLVDIEGGLERFPILQVLLELPKHRDKSNEEKDKVVEDNHTVMCISTDNGLEDLVTNGDSNVAQHVS